MCPQVLGVHLQKTCVVTEAQAAVIELAVLVSRLTRLPKDKVQSERQYLQIAIDKTAGERELQAWAWLTDKIDNHYAAQDGSNLA
jgi:hypothetical protein